ncbi:MAG: hypothetical protein II777_10335 [Clostridia bacterium]|nr:hypothetical protein [Clostridia bacterium]
MNKKDTVKKMPKDKLVIGAYILQPYAQTKRHIKELRDCGIELIVCFRPKDRETLDLLEKYGVGCILSGVLPGWWGGDGQSAGKMYEKLPLELYEKAAAEFEAHPAVWGIDTGDEPSALDFDHYGKITRFTERSFGGRFAYLNLYPNYASVAANTEDQTKCQLGTATYEEHIAEYVKKIDLPYISYDFYVYSLPESIGVGKMLENFITVSDACRGTGRDFWYIPQVNGLHETDFTSENMLRYQAYAALCYGANVINWACYTGGWWCNNVLDAEGNKTEQYDKLKNVNAELRRFGEKYMKYDFVKTHLLGFENEPWIEAFPSVKTARSLDTGAVRGLCSDGELIVGEGVCRKDRDKRALLVLNASDPYDRNKKKVKVKFETFMREVKIFSAAGPVELVKTENGYEFELEANRAVLVKLK